jgi:DnaJ-domain-containing protein 1
LLVYALDRHLNGTLVLEAPGGKKSAVLFVHGAASKAKTAEPIIYLGRVLLENGVIEETVHDRTLQRALGERQLHGQVLLSEGAVDETAVKRALREQVERQIEWMFTLPPEETVYGYYDGVDFLERWGGKDSPRGRPLATIWRGLRSHAQPGRVQDACARLGDTPLRLHRDAQLARFRFGREERPIVEVLRAKAQSLDALLQRDLADPNLAKRLVYTLLITRQLDLGGQDVEPVGVDEVPSSSGTSFRRPSDPEGGRRVFSPPPRMSDPGVWYAPPARPESRSGTHGRVTPAGAPARVPTPSPPPAIVSNPPTASATSKFPSDAPDRVSAMPLSAQRSSSRPPERLSQPTPSRRPSILSSRAPGRVSQNPRSSPPGAAETAALKQEIVTRASGPEQNYYELLGVPPDATASQIQAAFFQLAKKWHPDRLGSEFDDVRDAAVRVFSRLNDANFALSDPGRRSQYDSALAKGAANADEQQRVQAVLRAAAAFQRAEVLLKKNDLEGAEHETRLALEDDPEQADYSVLLAWIQAQRPGHALDDLIQVLSNAIKKEPNHLRARWYRGLLYKRAGNQTRALIDFRRVVEVDPHHVDAARELRLHEMRKTPPPTSPKGLGKWFKR